MVNIQLKLWLILVLYLSNHLMAYSNHGAPRKTFIVHMNKLAMGTTFSNHVEWYSSLIESISLSPKDLGNEHDDQRIIYIYESAFHGIAARLTNEEAEQLARESGVMSILPDTKYELQTTRSPKFLGLESYDKMITQFNNVTSHDVVVGVVDTGIWPESESFNDKSLNAVPRRWKGACEIGPGFEKRHCNKKIIGFYRGYEEDNGEINEAEEYKSARDQNGHGTHTAATIAGSPVHGANLFGYANGTARGMSPTARIAVYKVCWSAGCYSSDILSAVDKAVQDGVNILSISLAGGVSSYYNDSLSIAAFGAMEMGVFVSCAAGNDGPEPRSVANISPWMITVGASSMDRDFPGAVKLGSGKILRGVSVYEVQRSTMLPNKQYSVVYTKSDIMIPAYSSYCLEGSLEERFVTGKIVICDRGVNPRAQKGQVVKDAGGIGMILANTFADRGDLAADNHILPTVAVGEKEGNAIKKYVMKHRNSTASLAFCTTKVGVRPAPVVAAFSSRGPNVISPEILKPDVVAPGVNILAAWSGDTSPSGLETDERRVKFNILSGTSMSCPHVSGVAAWLMARHPDWSPAAIKSALITTAYIHDNMYGPLTDFATNRPSSPYDYGAGHINPPRALDPGLIYDIGPQDYFDFLCTQGLTLTELMLFTKFRQKCQHSFSSPRDLNYPSLSVIFPLDKKVRSLTLKRTAMNVGPPNSKYHVAVTGFKGVNVKVEPTTLNFTKKYKKLSYKVTFTTISRQVTPEFGGLTWNDGKHKVRSPIVIKWLSKL